METQAMQSTVQIETLGWVWIDKNAFPLDRFLAPKMDFQNDF